MSDWVQKQMDRLRQEQTEEASSVEEAQKGGPGSGHYGHAGRPGKRGGSQPGKGGGGGGGEASAPRGGGKTKAQIAYNERVAQAKGYLKKIDSGLRKHAAAQKKEPKNWGYVGDLAHYRQQVGDVLDFLSGADEATDWAKGEPKKWSAKDSYLYKLGQITDMMGQVRSKIDAHGREFSKTDGRSYEYAGSMGYVSELLRDVSDSLHGEGEYAE